VATTIGFYLSSTPTLPRIYCNAHGVYALAKKNRLSSKLS